MVTTLLILLNVASC